MGAVRRLTLRAARLADGLRRSDGASERAMQRQQPHRQQDKGEILLLKDFPCFLPEDGGVRFHGYITVQGRDYRLRLRGNTGPGGGADLSNAVLHGDPQLVALLQEHGALPMLSQRLKQASTIHEFLVELREMLERLHRVVPSAPALSFSSLHGRLVEEIEEVGWQHVTSVEEGVGDLTLGIELSDAAGRRHALSLRLLPDYPLTAPRCSAALPAHVELRWVSTGPGVGTSRLKNVVEQYAMAIAGYDELWHELEHIDAEAWVIEPEMPTRAIVYRRLAVGPHCALQVDLDASAPRAVPECKFFGMETAVAPLRQRLNLELHRWSPERHVLENLQLLLDVDFRPAPPAPAASISPATAGTAAMEGAEQGHGAECAICYSYRLDGAIPEKVCDNANCARCFHVDCMVEWLRGLATARTSFDTIFGTCPVSCARPILSHTA